MKGEETMSESLFSRKWTPSLDSPIGLSALKDEIERYKSMPRLMNIWGKLNGFFDSHFESGWEKETGLDWREWGKL